MSDDAIEYNDKGLKSLLKALKGDLPTAKVGILGNKNGRRDEGSNATIGAKHEFGSAGVVQRSFLRVPITDNMQEYLDKSGAFDKDALARVIKEGSIIEWVKKIGVIAETIVSDGFASGGFGKWAPWRPGYQNNTGQILVDTAQLRDSITSEVK